ncbi:toll/interleukin-1 receptor domain-containing protein [Coprococcus catus]|uniref:toll/interleukin-1 receptor domain-containing protein n=1 Tax=Coprococcus catus TaxID=116085 RepID=UPI003D07D007
MNFNKNNFQIITLLIAALSLIVTIFSVVDNTRLFLDNEIILAFATALVASLSATYVLSIIRRINPKQYIYISYTGQDKDTALLVSQILSEQFKRLSKYRFEIITVDSIPFGEDMSATMQKYIEKSDIVIVLVSENYITSEWCYNEFLSIANLNKRIIPIVLNSYSDLSRLPKDISNIKALSLSDCTSDKDFEEQLLRLAKDLIRQRKD